MALLDAKEPTKEPRRWLLTCQLQERQGALDRFVGALSHRGLSILAMHGEMDDTGQVFTATFEFTCTDAHVIQKLVKALEKQITVLSAHCVTLEAGEGLRSGFSPPSGAPGVSPVRCA